MPDARLDMDVRNRRVTVMGLGTHGGGAAAVRFLAGRGARVTVTDLADALQLTESIASLGDLPEIRFELGHHCDRDFRAADVVIVNPAVRPDNRLLQIAADAGATLTSEVELFMRCCPAPVVGVTGSNGKSTTAAMTAAILSADGRRTWLGGNIGNSLLEHLETIGPDDVVVLELSSFQLFHLSPDAPPAHVAVVTNCRPNHLDWHPSVEHYARSKRRILERQSSRDMAVLNSAAPELRSWRGSVRGRLFSEVPDEEIPLLRLVGRHHRQNAACAAAAAAALGCSRSSIEQALREFAGLSHRCELISETAGLRFYDDSAATTPESTIAALQSIEEPLWLLAGGKDKGADWDELARAIVAWGRGAAFFGDVGATLRRRVLDRAPDFECYAAETMAEAFAWCVAHSRRGEAILLSPACSSQDQFRDYVQRAGRFVELVRKFGGERSARSASRRRVRTAH